MNFRSLGSRSMGTLIASSAGVVAAYLTAVLLARQLGADAFGVYSVAISVVLAAVVVAKLGLDTGIVRPIAIEHETDEHGGARPIAAAALRVATISSLAAMLVLLLAAPLLADLFDMALTQTLRTLSLAVFPLTLTRITSQALRAGGFAAGSALTQFVVLPSTMAALMLVRDVGSPQEAARYFLLSAVLASVTSLLVWLWASDASEGKHAVSTRQLLAVGIPLLVVGSATLAMGWIDTWMLGIYLSAVDVGVYNAALRVAVSLSLLLLAVRTVVAPPMARAFDDGHWEEARALYRHSLRLLWAMAAIPGLIVLVFSEQILSFFFGQEYAHASDALRILAFGQLVALAMGPAAEGLVMAGRERRLRSIVVGTLALSVLLNMLLVPRFGLTGAASATAASLVIMKGLSLWFLDRFTGVVYSEAPGAR